MRQPTSALLQLRWASTAFHRFLLLLGLGLIASSVLVDLVRGDPSISIGLSFSGRPKQAAGFVVGLGVFAAGMLGAVARDALNGTTIRWLLALYLAGCSFVLFLVVAGPSAAGWTLFGYSVASWTLLGYAAAICLLLPPRLGLVTFAGLVGTTLLLEWVSHVKIGLTGLPLTMMDLRIAVANPAGLWDAMALPHWSRHLAVTVVSVGLLGWVFMAVLAAGRFLRHVWRHPGRFDPWGRSLLVGIIVIMASSHLQDVYETMGEDSSTWHPDRVARLVDRVGIWPFLGFSYHIESRAVGDIYVARDGEPPPEPEYVSELVRRYVAFPYPSSHASPVHPNIVMVLAESTFDPSSIFDLTGDWDAYLFEENELTDAIGPLRVNSKGGGTWIAEFETITGLDSRLFGYAGWYTHASLSPYVEHSFATYLGERGYQTWAFMANAGDFFNTRRAYANYGFQRVLDSKDLGSESDWFETDTAAIDSVKAVLGSDPMAPFFSYITLIENHFPHDCGFADDGGLTVRLASGAPFAQNCAVHEFLRRLGSTTEAIRSLVQYLENLEARTGRPFVLVMFGDHQPATFIGSGQYGPDFQPFRKSQDMYTTFFHIMSSAKPRLQCCSEALPVAALPSLVSSYVASSADDIYLGTNLWLFERCGSDAIRREFAGSLGSLEVGGLSARSASCESAYRSAVASYRASGVIRLTSD